MKVDSVLSMGIERRLALMCGFVRIEVPTLPDFGPGRKW